MLTNWSEYFPHPHHSGIQIVQNCSFTFNIFKSPVFIIIFFYKIILCVWPHYEQDVWLSIIKSDCGDKAVTLAGLVKLIPTTNWIIDKQFVFDEHHIYQMSDCLSPITFYVKRVSKG